MPVQPGHWLGAPSGSQSAELGLCTARAEDGFGMQQSPNPFFPQLLQCRGRTRAGGDVCSAIPCIASACAHPGINSSSATRVPSGHQTAARAMDGIMSLQSKCPHSRGGMLSLAVPAKSQEHGDPTCKAGYVPRPLPPLTFRLEICSLTALNTSRFPAFQGRFGKARLCLILFQMP